MIFIVGITKMNNNDKLYKILRVSKDANGQNKYEIAKLNEALLKQKMRQGLRLENAALEGDRLVGTTGSLGRFITDRKVKPLVIISELVDSFNNTLGYRVADCNGNIKAVRLADLLKYAQQARAKGLVAIQNGIYVEGCGVVKPHIRSFRNGGFPIEVLNTKRPKSTYQIQNNPTKNKANTLRIEEIFNPKQIEQLKLGKAHGVNIALYANKEFTAEQMKEIREGLEAGIKAKLYADPRFTVEQMKRLKAEMIRGFDVTPYANPAYSIAQMNQIRLGLISGVDISLYANPKTSAQEMSEIRMRLEEGIWCDCEASKIDATNL